jgi:methylenetetrahydrofolate reductase (NADPH)
MFGPIRSLLGRPAAGARPSNLTSISNGPDGAVDPAASARLAQDIAFEIVPMKSIERAIGELPPGAHVSVTCSPTGGIELTQQHAERLVADGFAVTPHIAARLVQSRRHAAELAAWARSHRLVEVFVIAGDAPEPAGPYDGALAFLHDFMAAAPGVERIGISGYPDGHALIDASAITDALHAKQALLDETGVDGWVSTQMCFDRDAIVSWLERERSAGLHLPVRLGVPGVVDRTRLMKVGVRTGVGASLRFLTKNAATVAQLVAPGGYDPAEIVGAISADAERLGIESLHSFTFNAVADTVDWHARITGGHRAA